MRFLNPLKKILVLVGIGAAVSFFWTSSSIADTDPNTAILTKIEQHTNDILTQVNLLPGYFDSIVKSATSWIATEDATGFTTQMATNINNLQTQVSNNLTTQNNNQLQISADLLGVQLSDLSKTPSPAATNMPEVNNVLYNNMIAKTPAVPSSPFDPKAYIENASGISFYHQAPQNWTKPVSSAAYRQYYDLVTSVESFSAYVLSGLQVENQTGNQVTTLQNSLINMATDGTDNGWLKSITSEDLGKVLRQILLFQSQSFVVQMQLLQTQKQLLTATVMTNSLIIASNRANEEMMVLKAQGQIPGAQ